MIYVIIILIAIIIFLGYSLSKKQKFQKEERNEYYAENQRLAAQHAKLQAEILADTENYNRIRQQITRCNKEFSTRSSELQNYFYNLRAQRNKDLEDQFLTKRKEQQEILNLQIQKMKTASSNKVIQIEQATNKAIQTLNNYVVQTNEKVIEWETQYNNLLQPLKRLQQQKMQHLFYTIQIPEQYQKDMQYLLTTVAPHVNHPDIISKLIWQQYVKPYLDDTFKRIGIKDQPGIYKITYIQNNKCYVGKSTNVKKRIADHFKSVIGIQSIADQAVHHQIKNTGLWNWMIEVIGYFPKEELSEKQKFYIKQFQAIQYGFNKNSGG